MRLLHAGHRDEPVRALSAPRAGDARRDLRPARRQSLPLHRLSADRRGGARNLHGRARRPVRRCRRRRRAQALGGHRRRQGSVRRRRERLFRRARQRALRSPSSTTGTRDAVLLGGATDVGLWITKNAARSPQDHLARSRRRARPDGGRRRRARYLCDDQP